jgi:hypothetical protein
MAEGTSNEKGLFKERVGERGESQRVSCPSCGWRDGSPPPLVCLSAQSVDHTPPPSRPEELAPAGHKGTASCHYPLIN